MNKVSKSLAEQKQAFKGQQHASTFVDEVTKNKIQRHLNDINDHITEQDIRNIDTNITATVLYPLDRSDNLRQNHLSGIF